MFCHFQRENFILVAMNSVEELAGPMTRLTLHSKPYELTLLQPGEPGQVKEVPKLHARSSSSDARRGERTLRVRKNSDSEVSYFAPDEAEKSNIKESNLRSSIDATVMAHMLIHESKHLTRSALEKSPNQWRKPARSVVFDDFPHDNMETEVNEANDEMEENWTPVLRKKKKKLRDRKVSMNSDEGVSCFHQFSCRSCGHLCCQENLNKDADKLFEIPGGRLELVLRSDVGRRPVSWSHRRLKVSFKSHGRRHQPRLQPVAGDSFDALQAEASSRTGRFSPSWSSASVNIKNLVTRRGLCGIVSLCHLLCRLQWDGVQVISW